jgi:hypothetical protein
MDLNDLWQEHKRFLSILGAGLAVFLIAYFVIDGRFSTKRNELKRTLTGNIHALAEERYGRAALQAAGEENEALSSSVRQLAQAVAFRTRPRFHYDAGGDSTQYYVLRSQIIQELSALAGRNRVILPAGLDLESPDTAQEERIVRHLEALDLVDRVLRIAIDARVKRVNSIRVQLDPALNARAGVGDIETTEVEIEFRSPAAAVVRMLALTQSATPGQPLTVSKIEITGARSKEDEITAKVTFLVVRLHGEVIEKTLAAASEVQQ